MRVEVGRGEGEVEEEQKELYTAFYEEERIGTWGRERGEGVGAVQRG